MTAQPPRDLVVCPVCGAIVTGVDEIVEPRRLCEPPTPLRNPDERWRRYEPCGCVT